MISPVSDHVARRIAIAALLLVGFAPAQAPAEPRNAPLASFQVDQLDLAYRAASAMPLMPHVKNRSRAQERVVAACLRLDQPLRAIAYNRGIENWRRGAGFADVAHWLARHGCSQDLVGQYLGLAEGAAEKVLADANEQAWRAHRIQLKIATTLLVMGSGDKADQVASGMKGFESNAFAATKAALLGVEAFDEQLAELDAMLATRDPEACSAAFQAFVELHRRLYREPERRQRLEQRILESSAPQLVRLPFLLELADSAVANADVERARDLIRDARAELETARFQPEDTVRTLARIAGSMHRAGETDAARTALEDAMKTFAAARERIFDFDRAEALTPVAEAWCELGDLAQAAKLYRMAVEEGSANPNARQRAEDLTATACSMALHAFAPDAELWSLMVGIQQQLGHPW